MHLEACYVAAMKRWTWQASAQLALFHGETWLTCARVQKAAEAVADSKTLKHAGHEIRLKHIYTKKQQLLAAGHSRTSSQEGPALSGGHL